MTNFFINNGNKIDLLQLKEGKAIKSDDKFLKKYDTNNNSVWDNDEINQFIADLNNADINGDGEIDKDESITWYSKITNTAIDKVKSVFNSDDKNKVYESLGNILKENAEEQSIARISQNAKEGLDIYHIAIGGDVSKGYNSIKELFDTEYAGDKVYRQLARKQVSSQLLEKAHSSNGLTAKEYVQVKIALLKALLGADKLSNAEQKNIEESIKNINFNQLDTFILILSNAENEEYNKLQKDVISDLIINNNLDNNKELGFKNGNLNSIGAFLQSSKVEEKMSFDKIFELEMGVPFNQNNSIQKYEESLQRMQIITMVHNKIEGLKNELTSLARVPAPYEPSHLQEVLALLPQLFESSEEMNNFLEQYGIKINNNNGFISYNYDIDNYPTTGINTAKDVEAETKAQQKAQAMCMALVARLNEKYEKLLDGKTLEDFQNDLKSSYEIAYGVKNSVDLASKFQESQQEGVGYIKMGVGFAGIAITLLSDGTLLPLTGMLIGAFGATGIGAWEAKTQKGGMTKEDAQAIKQELITSGILTLTGLGEGAAAKIGQTLLKSCPIFVQYIGEYGSMAVMGALTDYAVMGDIDLSQETISNLINIATGIVTHRKMAKAKEHNNIKHKTTETNNTHSSSRSTNEIINTVHVQDNGIPRISETEKSLFKNLNGRNFSEENGKTVENFDGTSLMNQKLEGIINDFSLEVKSKKFASSKEKINFIIEYVQNLKLPAEFKVELNYLLGNQPANRQFDCKQQSILFKTLCDEVGIECELKVGTFNGEPHMWTEVTINGKQHICDTMSKDNPFNKWGNSDPRYVIDGTVNNPQYGEKNSDYWAKKIEEEFALNPELEAKYGKKYCDLLNKTKESGRYANLKKLHEEIVAPKIKQAKDFIESQDLKGKLTKNELAEIYEYISNNPCEGVCGFIKKCIKTKEYKSMINENGYFSPYRLSLPEIVKIKDALIGSDLATLNEILKKNNLNIYNKLGDTSKYANQLQSIADNIIKLEKYNLEKILKKQELDVSINGQNKIIHANEKIPTSTRRIKIDFLELIKSNLLTLDCIDIAIDKNIQVPKTISWKTIYGEELTFTTQELLKKVQKNGFTSLTDPEIHALTECFANLYETNATFAKNIESLTTNKCNKIYSYVHGIKSQADSILQGSGLEIREHCIMRMLDRNVYNPIDNTKMGKIASFQELMTDIKTEALTQIRKAKASGKDNGFIEFKLQQYGISGINVFIEFKNGIFEIQTIMYN